ncbi:MAG TPA: ABC transporter permease [Gemmatirosa sp.]
MTDQVLPARVLPVRMTGGEASVTSWIGDVREILSDLVGSRDLLFQLARRDIAIRYKQAAMGFAWAVFMPVLVALAGILVRFATAFASGRTLGGGDVGEILVKSVPWSFFVGTIGFATGSLTGNMNLVTKVSFPREVLPLSSLLAQLLDFAVAAGIVGLLIPFFGAQLTWQLLWVPVLLALLLLFTAAATLFLSCANLFFRDVKYIVQTVLTFGIFFTPVFFTPAMLGRYGKYLMFNPIAPILEGLRLTIVQGHNLLEPLTTVSHGHVLTVWTPAYLGYVAAWTFGGLVAAMVLFHRSEFTFAEYV